MIFILKANELAEGRNERFNEGPLAGSGEFWKKNIKLNIYFDFWLYSFEVEGVISCGFGTTVIYF